MTAPRQLTVTLDLSREQAERLCRGARLGGAERLSIRRTLDQTPSGEEQRTRNTVIRWEPEMFKDEHGAFAIMRATPAGRFISLAAWEGLGSQSAIAAACTLERHGDESPANFLRRQLRALQETAIAAQPSGEEGVDVSGEKCPSCESPRPHLHPSIQQGGEVQPCRDPWHRSTRLGREAWEKLPASLTELRGDCSQPSGEEGEGKADVITVYRRMKAAAEGARAERDIMRAAVEVIADGPDDPCGVAQDALDADRKRREANLAALPAHAHDQEAPRVGYIAHWDGEPTEAGGGRIPFLYGREQGDGSFKDALDALMADLRGVLFAANPGQQVVIDREHIDRDGFYFVARTLPYLTEAQFKASAEAAHPHDQEARR